MSVAYLLCGTASQIHAGLASLPAGQVVAIRHEPAYAPWAVPAALTALTALTRLPLSRQTQLSDGSALDEILQPLVQLKELSLDHCRLAAVPAALSRCAQLTSLNLNNNALAGGWEHLQPLSRLQTLWMCDAADVSASLAYITGLSWLDLARCGNVPAASRHLAGLRLLSFLNLTSCGLAEVPAAVSALTALEALFLSHNRLAGGFDHLRPLARLNALYLHNNDLREVPAALSVLTALGALTLGNPEGGGWQRLRPLLKLASLDAFWHLDQAPASHLPVASEALRNLHPAAVERMLAQPDSSITRLLGLLERHGLPPPL